jgi:hypothetical protein
MAACATDSAGDKISVDYQMAEILEAFVDMSEQLITAVCEVFPECIYSAACRTAFMMKMSKTRDPQARKLDIVDAIQSWHTHMAPYYESCAAKKDDYVYADIDFLKTMRIKEKWNDNLDTETKDITFEYFNRLNRYASKYAALTSIYSGVPRGMLESVQQVAADLVSQIQSGEKSLTDIDFSALSQQMLTRMKPEDLEAYQHQLENSPGGAMGAVFNMMGTVGSMVKEMQSTGDPMADSLSSVLSTLSISRFTGK